MTTPRRKTRTWLAGLTLISIAQAVSLSLAWAHPGDARLDPDERRKLRQELRQHYGENRPQQQPPSAPPAANPGQGPNMAPVYPVPASGQGPQAGGGRMSAEDRRALRQQLKDLRGPEWASQRYYPARMPDQGPGGAPAFAPGGN